MRNFIFVKYKPKISMHWITNSYATKSPFWNPNYRILLDNLHEYTTHNGYMCDDYRNINTTFCKPIKMPLKSVTNIRSSMRSLNFSSHSPIQ